MSQALEQAALQPLELGANLGGRAVNTAGASALLQSGLGAANTQFRGGLVGPSIMAENLSKTDFNDLFKQLTTPSATTGISPLSSFGTSVGNLGSSIGNLFGFGSSSSQPYSSFANYGVNFDQG